MTADLTFCIIVLGFGYLISNIGLRWKCKSKITIALLMKIILFIYRTIPNNHRLNGFNKTKAYKI